MKLVGARLDDQVHHGSWTAPCFRAALTLNREFFQRVQRHQHAGNALNPTLIRRGRVVRRVVIVDALDLLIDLAGPESIERSAAAIASEPRRERNHHREVPAVYG